MNQTNLIFTKALEPIRDNCQELVIMPLKIQTDNHFNRVWIDLEILGQPRSFINNSTISNYRVRFELINESLGCLELRRGDLSSNRDSIRFTTTLFKREFTAINLADLEREATKAVSDLLEFIS